MFQIVYVSTAVLPFTDEQLQALLQVSRQKNQAQNITGLLLYLNGNFIQLLEGRKDDVLTLCDRIARDTRHRGMVNLLEDYCEKRDCPSWSMGFKKIDGPTASELPGYSDFIERGADISSLRSSALRLLEFFRELHTERGEG